MTASIAVIYFFFVLMFTMRPIFTRLQVGVFQDQFNVTVNVVNEKHKVVENSIKKSESGTLEMTEVTETYIKHVHHGRESGKKFPYPLKSKDVGVSGESGESSEKEFVIIVNASTLTRENGKYGKVTEFITFLWFPNPTPMNLRESSNLWKQNRFIGRKLTGEKIRVPCQFRFLRSEAGSEINGEYSLSLNFPLSAENERFRFHYNCHNQKFETKRLRTNTGNQNQQDEISPKEWRLICQPSTIHFTRVKYNPKNECIFINHSNKNTSGNLDLNQYNYRRKQKRQTENNDDIGNNSPGENSGLPHQEKLIRINSWIRRKYLLIANISWDSIPLTMNTSSSHKYFLLTWEILGGGLRGNLVTHEEFATISLVPQTVYSVQVAYLPGSEHLTNPTTFDLMELLPAESELQRIPIIASIIVNTSDSIYLENDDKVEESGESSNASAEKSELSLPLISNTRTVHVPKPEIAKSNSTSLNASTNVLRKSFIVIQTTELSPEFRKSSAFLEYPIVRIPIPIPETYPSPSVSNNTSKVKKSVHLLLSESRSRSSVCNETPILLTAAVAGILVAGFIVFNLTLFLWWKLRKVGSHHCSIPTISNGKIFLSTRKGCNMRDPLVLSDSCDDFGGKATTMTPSYTYHQNKIV